MRLDLSRAVGKTFEDAMAKEAQLRPHKLAERVKAGYPALVKDYGDQLALTALAAMFRKRLKRVTEETDPLFMAMGEKVPRAVAIPASGEEEPYYVPMARVTVVELQAAVSLLSDQIKADTARRNALRDLLRRCKALRPAGTERVADVLRRAQPAAA